MYLRGFGVDQKSMLGVSLWFWLYFELFLCGASGFYQRKRKPKASNPVLWSFLGLNGIQDGPQMAPRS